MNHNLFILMDDQGCKEVASEAVPKICSKCTGEHLCQSAIQGYFHNLDPDPGPWTRTLKTCTLKKLDPEKPEINIGLKNMSDFR